MIQRNELTFSGGHSREVGGVAFEKNTAVGVGATYRFRITPNVEVESGVFAALQPSPNICTRFFCYDPDDRFIWVPFGPRFVLPLKNGRIELSAGGGGLYEKYWVSNPAFVGANITSYSGWGGYANAGAAFALDRGHHFWVGASPRWFLANTSNRRDRWFMITGDLSYRF